MAAYLSATAAGVLAVILFQYKVTGVWFAYFKTQSHFLNRTLQWPELPFTTWDGLRLLWLDGFALFTGLLAAAILCALLLRRHRKTKDPDQATIFSLCYLALALLSVIFFNGKDVRGGTSLMGANRYLLATPYFTVLLFSLHTRLNLTLNIGLVL